MMSRGPRLRNPTAASGSSTITPAMRNCRSPSPIASPVFTPRRASRRSSTHTVPVAGASRVAVPATVRVSPMRSSPRRGYPGSTALISASTFASPASTMLGNLSRWTSASPARRASSPKASPSGRSDTSTRSAPSRLFAWLPRADFIRSAKNATVVTLATAMTSTAASRRSSPARQSRTSMRPARTTERSIRPPRPRRGARTRCAVGAGSATRAPRRGSRAAASSGSRDSART